MKISMNGFRKNFGNDVRKLKSLVIDAANDELHDKNELFEAMNDVIMKMNTLYCIYDNEQEDFKDMSNIEIELIEIEE
jgi:hypothetical protein